MSLAPYSIVPLRRGTRASEPPGSTVAQAWSCPLWARPQGAPGTLCRPARYRAPRAEPRSPGRERRVGALAARRESLRVAEAAPRSRRRARGPTPRLTQVTRVTRALAHWQARPG